MKMATKSDEPSTTESVIGKKIINSPMIPGQRPRGTKAATVVAVEAFAASVWNYSSFLPWVSNETWLMENITIADYNDMLAMEANITGTQCHMANYSGPGCHQTCIETCVEVCDDYRIPVICNKTGGNPDWQPVNFDNFGWAMMTLFT